MVCAVHHELDAFGNGAELPDNQSIIDEIVEVRYVLLELVCAINIIIVGVVSDDDARILHHILDVAKARNLGIWECSVRIGPVGNIVHGAKSRFISQQVTKISRDEAKYSSISSVSTGTSGCHIVPAAHFPIGSSDSACNRPGSPAETPCFCMRTGHRHSTICSILH